MDIKKKAFVFDTNFVVGLENHDLTTVVKNLSDRFTVYAPQFSINERIAQQQLELKKKYGDLEKGIKDYKGIATINIYAPFEKSSIRKKESIQRGYEHLFREHIIPFSIEISVFTRLLERTYQKAPPFSTDPKASDKGFKDSLIWISLLDFFKNHGEDTVVFVTDDNGFKNNAEALCKEFKDYTGKSITIEGNEYYKTVTSTNAPIPTRPKEELPLPDMKRVREKIKDAIFSLCGFSYTVDYDEEWEKNFNLYQKVDSAYLETVFSRLENYVKEHIFETHLSAKEILDLDDRITDLNPVPISAIEDALKIYQEVQQNFPDYLPQFYNAAAAIINNNYVKTETVDNYDDLPF